MGYEYSGAPVGPDTIAKALHRFRTSPARTPLMLTSGDKMAETCYETVDGDLKTCPTEHNTCPCEHGKLKCMSLGYCWHALPNVRMKIVNFVRNPIDTVIRYQQWHISFCIQYINTSTSQLLRLPREQDRTRGMAYNDTSQGVCIVDG